MAHLKGILILPILLFPPISHCEENLKEDLRKCDSGLEKCDEFSAEMDHEKIKYLEPKETTEFSKETVGNFLDSFIADLKKYEAEMMSAYLMQEDEIFGIGDINFNIRPEEIVYTMIQTFELLDINGDAKISKEEMMKYTQDLKLQKSEKEEILHQFPEALLDFHAFVQIIQKLGGNIESALDRIATILAFYPSNIGKDEVKGVLDHFLSIDLDENGMLTQEEFKASITENPLNGKMITEENKELLFREWDTDESNDLNFTEFLATMRQPSDFQQVEQFIAAADQDNNSHLNKEEFQNYLNKESMELDLPLLAVHKIYQVFESCDENLDDLLSLWELQMILEEHEETIILNKATGAFEIYDDDKDGVLDTDEFKVYIKLVSVLFGQKISPEFFYEITDLNKNGQVEFEEFIELAVKIAHLTPSFVFQLFYTLVDKL